MAIQYLHHGLTFALNILLPTTLMLINFVLCMLMTSCAQYHICDPLNENPTGLHNSGFEIFAIELHWVKNV